MLTKPNNLMNPLRLFCALTLLCVSLFGADAPKGERVLVTAHSFHIFTASRLAPLALAAGIDGHKLVAAQMIVPARLRGVTAIAAGSYHTVALKLD